MRSQFLIFNSVNSLSKCLGFFFKIVKIKNTENYSEYSRCSKSDFTMFQRSTDYDKTKNREKRRSEALYNTNI